MLDHCPAHAPVFLEQDRRRQPLAQRADGLLAAEFGREQGRARGMSVQQTLDFGQSGRALERRGLVDPEGGGGGAKADITLQFPAVVQPQQTGGREDVAGAGAVDRRQRKGRESVLCIALGKGLHRFAAIGDDDQTRARRQQLGGQIGQMGGVEPGPGAAQVSDAGDNDMAERRQGVGGVDDVAADDFQTQRVRQPGGLGGGPVGLGVGAQIAGPGQHPGPHLGPAPLAVPIADGVALAVGHDENARERCAHMVGAVKPPRLDERMALDLASDQVGVGILPQLVAEQR